MKANEKRAVALTVFLFVYVLGLPVLKLFGITSISWTIALLPIFIPWIVLFSVLVFSVPFFAYIFILEWLYELFPDKQSDNR